jgi:hypothetical protein
VGFGQLIGSRYDRTLGVLHGRELGFGYPLYIDDAVVFFPCLWWVSFFLFPSFPGFCLASNSSFYVPPFGDSCVLTSTKDGAHHR